MLTSLSIVLTAACYVRGRPSGSVAARDGTMAMGMAAVAVALLSPLDGLAGSLASAHMVQHVLLIAVAAPLLAHAAPGAALSRGLPVWFRQQTATIRRGFGIDADRVRRLRNPAGRVLAFVILLWVWHASVLYEAALGNAAVHVLQHASFLGAGILVWSVVLGPSRVTVARPTAVLVVFLLTLQNVLLSALLTFATEPWYDRYRQTAPDHGLDPLTDQHVAGVVMWVPVGFIHIGIALGLLGSWLASDEEPFTTRRETA